VTPESESNYATFASTSRDIGVQARELPLLRYQDVKERRKRGIRAEVIDEFKALVSHFCHGDENAMHNLALAILSSTKFTTEFSISQFPAQNHIHQSADDHFLKSLAKEYESCKDQERNKVIRQQSAKLKLRVHIGNTLKDSRIINQGDFGINANFAPRDRVEAAAE